MTFKYHTENLRTLEYAIKQIQRDLRVYIAKDNAMAEMVYTRILSYLVVSWTEVSLQKLICQRRLFSTNEEKAIQSKKSLEQKWKTCLDLAVRKQFNIHNASIISKLPFTYKSYYKELGRIIDEDLVPSIEVRNRIAHGQWKYAFNKECSDLSPGIIANIRKENIITLQMKMKVLKTMSSIINDFCISTDLVQRDFDKKYKLIDDQINNLHKRSYSEYRLQMQKKFDRGMAKINNESIRNANK